MIYVKLFVLVFCFSKIQSQKHFNVAVVDYETVMEYADSQMDIIHRNVEIYEKIIRKMYFKNVDILVLPDYGLTSNSIETEIALSGFAFEVKDNLLHKNLCGTDEIVDLNPFLATISCDASYYKMYLVIGIIETDYDTDKYWISTIVFDSNGILIARYRRKHLLNLEQFTPGTEDVCIFDTKFGKFGLLSGFDFLYNNLTRLDNEDVEKVILTSSIKQNLPHIHGLSLHSAFAVKNDLVVIAASIKTRNGEYPGGGIYINNKFYMGADYDNAIIVKFTQRFKRQFNSQVLIMSEKNHNRLYESFNPNQLCLENLDTNTPGCKIEAKFFNESDKIFYKKATCMKNALTNEEIKVKFCGIVYCTNNSSCTTKLEKQIYINHIKIQMNATNESYPYPLSIRSNFHPADHYTYNKTSITINSTETQKNIILFGFLLISNAPIYSTTNAENTTKVTFIENIDTTSFSSAYSTYIFSPFLFHLIFVIVMSLFLGGM